MAPTPRLVRRARRAVAAAALAATAVAAVASVVPAPVGAQETEVIDDPRLDPSLAGVQVQSDGYAKARGAYRVASGQLAESRARLASLDEVLTSLTTERDRLQAEIDAARQRGDAARAELDRRQSSLRALAVESYVQGRGAGSDQLVGGVEAATTSARAEAMVSDVAERRTEQVREARATMDDADRVVRDDTEALGTVGARLDEATAQHASTTEEVRVRQAAADGARRSMADWRLTADVAGSDLPLVALDAYVKAAGRMRVERPECGIRWSGLAGIGKVESGHGTYGGSRLGADGRTSQPIVGIPLDGTNGTAVVGDTDGGRWDGDPTVDRAVGPMQFIPGSWASLGRDGNGDGQADPSNIYDAALAAAGLLCRAGGSGLDGDAGLYRGALGYNASATYAALVVRTANAYQAREAELIPPPPTTTTTAPPADTAPAPAPPVQGPVVAPSSPPPSAPVDGAPPAG